MIIGRASNWFKVFSDVVLFISCVGPQILTNLLHGWLVG